MKQQKQLLLLFLAVCLLAASLVLHFSNSVVYSNEKQVEEIQRVIHDRAARSKQLAIDLISTQCGGFDDFNEYPERWKSASHDEEIALFKYDKENLLYWNDNTLPVGLDMLRNEPTNRLWKLKNGWYLAHRIESDSCNVVALALIKREYSYSNKYLDDYFKNAENVDKSSKLSVDSLPNSLSIIARDGITIAYFIPEINNPEEGKEQISAILLFLLGIFVILLILHIKIVQTSHSIRNLFYFWLGLFVLRWSVFYLQWPQILFESVLFSPGDYASSNWLPTLGDLLLNSFLIFYGVIIVFLASKQIVNLKRSFLFFGIIASFCLVYFCIYLIGSLVIDSSIGFEINNISARSNATYFAYFITAVLLGAAFLCFSILPVIRSLKFRIFLVFFISIFILLQNYYCTDCIVFVFSLVILLISQITRWWVLRTHGKLIVNLVFLSALGTLILIHFTNKRELEKRSLLVTSLSAERDPIAERIFLEAEKKIENDTLLKSYLRPGTLITGQVRDLAQLYFNGYWEKYKINVQIFGADECPLTSLYANAGRDPALFDQLIDSIGIPTQSEHFYFLNNNSGRISYIARIDVHESMPDTSTLARLYIEFNSRYTPEEIGYPELLLDRKVKTNTDLSRYSYARYFNGRLVSHFGQFPYRLEDNQFNAVKKDSTIIIKSDSYSHLVSRSGPNTIVVLSLQKAGVLQLLTPFSYLLLLFVFVVGLGYLVLYEIRFQNISFKRKIQSAIVLILFISLLLIGGGTILYIISNNAQKNQRTISEKIHSILVETELLLGRQDFLDPAKADEIAYALSRQSNVFFSDINLFSPSGILYASSRTKLFDEGLISRKINPEAFYHLTVENSSEFILNERIGQLEYLSAYVPLRNGENKVIGFLNLPYFARQSELQREIASFVVAIVNIYILLMVLVLIAAIILSNSVTEPLRLLQERLGSVRIGGKNEAIKWKSRDEIGKLIEEYNRMLGELSESADKLAKSERESAWREMAKQVAHEIKNPLTPMKLNTQMLKRAWDDRAPEFENRLNRYAQNLIEQIDALSQIATEFGNFAQMPRMKNEAVDMFQLLQQVVDFHQNQKCHISFDSSHSGPCYVLTDKDQMLRVFNNLIKNAEQAIPDDRKGVIKLFLQVLANRVIIEIKDNGKGISEDLCDRIFHPNFTTKSTGMGLGLALVKNIVESSNGSIRFETVIDQETTFTITLPLMKDF
jgi:two-component system nitrogen regulation sensor histidine kinase NtrY